MLDQGFQQDIEEIFKSITQELETVGRKKNSLQILLFSATIPAWVKQVGSKYMKPDYKTIDMVRSDENKTSKTVQHLKIVFQTKN